MKKLLILISIVLFGFIAYAVDSTKPATHNSSWERLHGQASKANMAECLSCHDERSECIECHEDKSPRNHTSTFVNKTHGLEARWNRNNCQVCHKVDFCNSCHDTAYPISHSRANFASGNASDPGSHCGTSCVLPSGNWSNTPSKNCLVCHQTRPTVQATGVPHSMR